ncbi:hypothetical protein BH23ACT12_BH23ACT12_20620 [soil metagenome]
MVDSTGLLVLANARARGIFGLQPNDVGRPFQDLELSWRPAQLQPLVERAQREQKKISQRGVAWSALGENMYMDIDVVPLHDNGSRVLGVGVHFFDVSRERSLREELQSTNEELEATNAELGDRTADLNRLNRFLETMMQSVRTSIIVLDSALRVKMWNRHSEQLWGLRSEKVVGSALLGLDSGLPVEGLASALTGLLRGITDHTETRARRGGPQRPKLPLPGFHSPYEAGFRRSRRAGFDTAAGSRAGSVRRVGGRARKRQFSLDNWSRLVNPKHAQ